MFSSGDGSTTHVGLLASAGMGHLIPFLRLAALLLRRQQCHVTLITANTTVSNAESQLISRFLSSSPQVSHLTFSPIPIDPSTAATNDPFWLQFESLRRSSAVLLPPLLSSVTSPPLSALVIDVSLITPAAAVAESLSIPAYVLFTSSLRMLSLFSHFPTIAASPGYTDSLRATGARIPGVASPLPRASIPPPLLDPTSLFTTIFLTDAPKLKTLLRGVLVNTFQSLEPELFSALENGELASNLPNLFPVGPLPQCEFEHPPPAEGTGTVEWLDAQPVGSVVYVGFGSRTAVGREQMREIGEGLVRSGCRFLWVVKDKKVDREEGGEDGLEEILGREVVERMKEKGLVVRHWVDQAEILRHGAVGGFVTHCGWNSTVEAAMYGVRVLAWPGQGEQGVNAGVVRECGLGVWVERWVTGGAEAMVVKGDEIGERVREMMENNELRSAAAELRKAASGEAARRREEVIDKLIGEWKE